LLVANFQQKVGDDASVKNASGEKKLGRRKGCPLVIQTPKGGVLLLQHIIRELNIKAALNEVLLLNGVVCVHWISVCLSYCLFYSKHVV
jgi:hypothetical protein